jgi:hypothetical protein
MGMVNEWFTPAKTQRRSSGPMPTFASDPAGTLANVGIKGPPANIGF